VGDYGQFCPVAKASEVLCQRWTPLIVRELLFGSRRFNEVQRGVPLMSPTLLSQRLKELNRAGVVDRTDRGDYELTEAGQELFGIIQSLGEWGQRWARSDYRAEELDAGLLLWDIHRHLRQVELPVERCVVQFDFPGEPSGKRRYWVVSGRDGADVCLVDPGFPVDVWVTASLRALTEVWMGDSTFVEEMRKGRIELEGPRRLVRCIPSWIGQHPALASVKPARPRGEPAGRS
jgi:DNA-binding HxlR family transcriptional regulator